MHNSSLNHTFRLIWSACAGTYVAVAETTRGRGKGGRAGRVAAVVLAALAGNAFADASTGVMLNGTNTVNSTGASAVIDGASSTGYFVQSGSLTINNATLQNFQTKGGAGSGGGAGLGGAVFVNQGATVTLNNVNFVSNTVVGGAGGSGSYGGALNNINQINTPLPKAASGSTPDQQIYVDVNGTTGTNGAKGMSQTAVFGAQAGGNGGSGGDGSGMSPPLIVGLVNNGLGVVAWTADLVATSADPFTAPIIAAAALSLANAVISVADSMIAIDRFNKSVSDGLSGIGGNGGTGGNGGNGGDFRGGAAGGNGGNGGVGASGTPSATATDVVDSLVAAGVLASGGLLAPILIPSRSLILNPYGGGAAGGDGGSGGNGGMGDFGAGGGAGGI